MRKTILSLAIACMALSNTQVWAQDNNVLRRANKLAQQHYQVRNDDMLVPSEALYTTNGINMKKVFAFDLDEEAISEELTLKQLGSDWQNDYLVTYEFSWTGDIESTLSQTWLNGDWENDKLETNTYNLSTYLIEETLQQEWENGDWANKTKLSYNFYDEGVQIISYDWANNSWNVSELYTITYEMTGYEVLRQYMAGGAWQNDERILYVFNDDFNVSIVLEQDFEDNSWVNDERRTYNYEGLVFTSVDYDKWTTDWVAEGRASYTYDSRRNATHGQYQAYENGQWVDADGDLEMNYCDNSETLELEAQQITMTYIDPTGLAENPTQNRFSPCPNPAQDMVNILGEGFEKAELYNLAGQRIATDHNAQIDVKALPAGVYMLRIVGHGSSEMHRLVVD